jgi:tetratricopeptide (TPR) repeat protein
MTGEREMKSIEELNNMAISELSNNGDYYLAKKYLKANAKRDPSYITYNNLAWYYFKIEELNPFRYDLCSFKKSTRYCLKALQLKTNLSSLRLLRNIHYVQEEYGKAKDIQERVFESFENTQDIENYIDDYYVMGCINMGLKDYESAEKFLKKAYEYYYSKQTFNDDDVFFTYALCLVKLGRYNDANRIGDYILDTLGGESISLHGILMIYYNTDNFEKIKENIEQFEQQWAIHEDELAIILLTYKHFYSNDEVEKKYFKIVEDIKNGCNRGWHKRDLVPLKITYEKIRNGLKPEIKYEPLHFFISNYIKY